MPSNYTLTIWTSISCFEYGETRYILTAIGHSRPFVDVVVTAEISDDVVAGGGFAGGGFVSGGATQAEAVKKIGFV